METRGHSSVERPYFIVAHRLCKNTQLWQEWVAWLPTGLLGAVAWVGVGSARSCVAVVVARCRCCCDGPSCCPCWSSWSSRLAVPPLGAVGCSRRVCCGAWEEVKRATGLNTVLHLVCICMDTAH